MDRRVFVKSGAALAAWGTVHPQAALAADAVQKNLGQMAWAAGTWYRPYVSKLSHTADTPTWVQIDLGVRQRMDALRIYPAFGLGDLRGTGYGFPARFRVEAADDPEFTHPRVLVDFAQDDFAEPYDEIREFNVEGAAERFVRLTALKLRKSQDGAGYQLALNKLGILSGGRDVAVRCAVTADARLGNPKDLAQLTRPERPMGEGVVTDNPANVTAAMGWQRVPDRAVAPLGDVTLGEGPFQRAMEDNITYLLGSYSVDEMLRPFRERAGKPVRAGLRPPIHFWDTSLPGSSAGRFLMGAANTLRWMEHARLREAMNEIVDGIDECKQANGYIMAYPEELMLCSERGGYTRAWVTHGLIEAGISGNQKAFPLLRGFYDWFDRCPQLPKLMRGGAQGVQGMIANTRMYFTPVGKPEDLQVIQRYYQENYWLEGLAKRDVDMVWQYPYDRPHNYLITDFEAYLDLYRATGEKRYKDAVDGAWQLYHDNWEHVGGSIAITEMGEFPPKSYRLEAQAPFCETGETCGSVFWVKLNQRLLNMEPEAERFAAEIEKSIYNVGLANQVRGKGINYHTRLSGMKGDLLETLCTNSCCEGQGTRLLGSLAEYIFSVAEDGIFVNLFEPSEVKWQQNGAAITAKLVSHFPEKPEVKIEVTCAAPAEAKVRIRVPQWASGPMAIAVNGEQTATGKPGSYVTLARTWKTGDVIDFRLPIGFRMTKYVGLDRMEGCERYALEYGPVLMALVGSDSARLRVAGGQPEDLIHQLKKDEFHPLHFALTGNSRWRFMPYWKVLTEPFTCFPGVITA